MSLDLRDSGFSIPELLVAATIMLVVSSSLLALAHGVVAPGSAGASAIDLEDRTRAAMSNVRNALERAGAGLDQGLLRGALPSSVPGVIPRRLGSSNADAPTAARPDAFTVLTIPAVAGQTTLAAPLTSLTLTVSAAPLCISGRDLCGLADHVIVFNSLGFDLYRVIQAAGSTATLQLQGAISAGPFDQGAAVASVDARAFYVDPALRQLRTSDTDQTDVAVIDDVESMTVKYWATTDLTMEPKPPSGVANCLYDASGSLLPQVVPTGVSEDGLVELPLTALNDGPWCGNGSTRFDADLFRVRRLAVTLRLQASDAGVRSTGPLFLNPGQSRDALRSVPDAVISFSVTPRNLEGSRP
jgi:hypothetical protein